MSFYYTILLRENNGFIRPYFGGLTRAEKFHALMTPGTDSRAAVPSAAGMPRVSRFPCSGGEEQKHSAD